ncbi:transposase [Agrobacterium salinitolerans]|uniref:Transposase n=2 Tax=Agrobacterium salinitolerans TaxID=1183413 RepID=A0A9X9PCF1_9HYPH|nr:transposase [Agrobacterium salinitolerans]
MEIISGVERRRRWSKEAKLEILAEADEPGVRIGDVARRHDIHPGQIRLWRKTFSHFRTRPHKRGSCGERIMIHSP